MKEITKKSFYTGEEKDCGVWSKQCNVCLATNYDNDGKYKKFNVIHEFNFNKILVYMCDDCVKKLSTMTNLIVEDNLKKVKKSARVEENDLYDMRNANIPYDLKEKYSHCIHQVYLANSGLDDFYNICNMYNIDFKK